MTAPSRPSTGHARTTGPALPAGPAGQLDAYLEAQRDLRFYGLDDDTVAESLWEERMEREDRMSDYGGAAA